MIEYRVTKYDPALRDERGAYIRDEWTSFTDIGRTFGSVTLTENEYQRIEQCYIDSALSFLQEGGLETVRVTGLENHMSLPLEFSEGSIFCLEQVGDLIRKILRNEFWCRLENPCGFLHFGWDYYMYIGVPQHCKHAEERATELGLYVEEFASPYKD